MEPSRTTWNHVIETIWTCVGLSERLWTIWSYLEAFGATSNYLKPSGDIWRHLEPVGPIWVHLDQLEVWGAIWSHLRRSGASYLEPFGSIRTFVLKIISPFKLLSQVVGLGFESAQRLEAALPTCRVPQRLVH